MNKVILIGGSNGIGLAIANQLMKKNVKITIIDRSVPNEENYPSKEYEYIQMNLLDFDVDIIKKLSEQDYDALIITAGYGRVAKFSNIDLVEIKNQMQVNTVSIMQIIKCFYNNIKSNKNFYTGIMVSIAGHISSPLFSTYSASKAALSKFIEALNVELEKEGTDNRILEISPGSIKGTKFNGGENNLPELYNLANQIIEKIKERETLFIPEYENVFKNVINRYTENPRKFGLESYEYKISKNRISEERKIKIGYLSGTFDLFHIGHLNLLKRAKEQCDYLIVGVHPNGAHKGKETFIPLEERKLIVKSCKYVDQVVDSCKEDNEAWRLYHYDKLFVGSDYKGTERFQRYEEYFKDKNVEIVYFPYTKSTTSTQIRELIMKETNSYN